MNTDERRALRTALMDWLFTRTNGSSDPYINPTNFPGHTCRHPACLQQCDLNDAVQYLAGQRLIVIRSENANGKAQSISLTHRGIVEYEEATSDPTRPTRNLAPMITIIKDNSGMVQVGTHGSTQTGVFGERDRAGIEAFIREARQALEKLSDGDRALAAGTLANMETELASEQPRFAVLRSMGTMVLSLVIGTLGSTGGDYLSGLLGITGAA